MSIVSIQNLKIEFAGKTLFENVSFDVNEGDAVGLIGANGTGKTSLFRVLTGELEPAEGGVFLSKLTKVGYLEQHACQGSGSYCGNKADQRALRYTAYYHADERSPQHHGFRRHVEKTRLLTDGR